MSQFLNQRKMRAAVVVTMICVGLTAFRAGQTVAGPPTIRAARPGRAIAKPVPRTPRVPPNRARGPSAGPSLPTPILSTNLKIKQGSGDFSNWVTKTTINEAGYTLMRWTNTRSNVVAVQWQVTSVALPWGNPDANQPGVIGKGLISPIAKGASTIFPIHLDKILPQTPANKPKNYYVRIVVFTAPGNKASLAAKPVTVEYRKPSNHVTKFTPEGLQQTVKQKHAWMYKKSPMPIQIDLEKLYVGNSNENADEPYLFVFVVYVDGTTINPLNFASSTVRIDCPSKTHGNVPDHDKHGNDLDTAKTANIPASTGRFKKTIVPIGYGLADDLEDVNGSIGQAMKDNTSVYIVVVAMEEDNTSTSAANAVRKAMRKKFQSIANGVVQQLTLAGLTNGSTPAFDLADLQNEMKDKAFDAAKDATLHSGWWSPLFAPIVLAQIADTDDCVGCAYKEVTLGQLLASGPGGIPFQLNLANPSDWEGSYTVRGKIRRKN